MKIVINAYSARVGGGQTYLINLLQRLAHTEGVTIYLFAPTSLKIVDSEKIIRLSSNWPTENPLLRAVWEKFVLPILLLRLNANILFCPGGVVGTKSLGKCKTVTMFRNMIPFDMEIRKSLPFGWQRARNWILERVMIDSMRKADLVIFISDYARGIIENRIQLRSAVTISHGVSEEFRPNITALVRPPYLPTGKYILYVSKFDVYKHHAEVVFAYSMLPKDVKEKYSLVLIGDYHTPSGEIVENLIEEKQLERYIHLLGNIEYATIPGAYKNAELIIFASSCENCPNILLEALGAGRPIISSNKMPMPEFGGEAVEYFDPRNPEDLMYGMLKILNSKDYSAELGRRAREKSRLYNWDYTAKKTWEHILTLSNDRESKENENIDS